MLSLPDQSKKDWNQLHRAEIDALASALYAQPVDVYVVGGHHTDHEIKLPADRNDLYRLGGWSAGDSRR